MQTINIHAAKTQLSRLADRLSLPFPETPEEATADASGGPAASDPARAAIATFAGCWADMSDDDFAALEAERQERRHAAFTNRPAD